MRMSRCAWSPRSRAALPLSPAHCAQPVGGDGGSASGAAGDGASGSWASAEAVVLQPGANSVELQWGPPCAGAFLPTRAVFALGAVTLRAQLANPTSFDVAVCGSPAARRAAGVDAGTAGHSEPNADGNGGARNGASGAAVPRGGGLHAVRHAPTAAMRCSA